MKRFRPLARLILVAFMAMPTASCGSPSSSPADPTVEHDAGDEAESEDSSVTPEDSSSPETSVVESGTDSAAGQETSPEKDVNTDEASSVECSSDLDCASDGDTTPCDGQLVCNQGHCEMDPASVPHCDTSLDPPCQVSKCDPSSVLCLLQPVTDGTSCVIGKFCSETGSCKDGACVPIPKQCPASCQQCDESEAACVLQSGWCLIGGQCFHGSERNPVNPCEACDPGQPDQWSTLPAGTTCAATEACSQSGACNSAHLCEAIPITPEVPAAWYPRSGALLGSLHAPSSFMARRVVLKWKKSSNSPGCPQPTYQVQVDDSCTGGGLDTCAFASPEAEASGLTGTEWETPDLAVSSVLPVGARYAWRVRACRGSQCSAYGPVMYFDLGRVRHDLNGDGYSEVIAGGDMMSPQGRMLVFPGPADADPILPSVTLVENEPFTIAGNFGLASSTGDLNGDGYADLVLIDISWPENANSMAAKRILVFRGGPSGISTTPDQAIKAPTSPGDWTDCPFSGFIAVDDFNADGFGDILIGASGCAARVGGFVFHSSSAGVPTTPSTSVVLPSSEASYFVDGVASGGDQNGDGIVDFAITRGLSAYGNSGVVTLYKGARSGQYPAWMTPYSTGVRHYTRVVPIRMGGDISGDGVDDMMVSYNPKVLDNYFTVRALSFGSAFAVLGPSAEDFGHGFSLDSDANGDGKADVVIGSPTGDAYCYRGPLAPVVLAEKLPTDGGRFGWDVASVGDFNGDGLGDVVLSDPLSQGTVYLFEGGVTGYAPAKWIVNPVTNTAGGFGSTLTH